MFVGVLYIRREMVLTRPQGLGVSNSYQAGIIHLSLEKKQEIIKLTFREYIQYRLQGYRNFYIYLNYYLIYCMYL